jgi:hypothetical protein
MSANKFSSVTGRRTVKRSERQQWKRTLTN